MQHWLEVGDKGIPYSIHYRKRKTVGITVSREEGVRVLTPRWVSLKQIEEILRQKSGWILKKQAEVLEKSRNADLEDGMQLLLLGSEMKLLLLEKGDMVRPKVLKCPGNVTIFVPEGVTGERRKQFVREALTRWYREQAVEFIKGRIELYSGIMGVSPSKVVVKEQKSRWGSCSSKGNVNLNWRLVMMPPEVVDYVVVHELAHLKVLNHSKAFWELVGSVLGDYLQRRKLLKLFEKNLKF